ncbi:MAG: hypothetical protein AB9846_11915 [Tenuifilaceae bacterium]
MKFEEGAWYYFAIDSIIKIPEKGDHFIIRHDHGRKMLLNCKYYVKYNFQLGQIIHCRVDKVNCTGQVYLEPKHPYYIENNLYNFKIESIKKNEDNSNTITLKDIFENDLQIILNEFNEDILEKSINLKVLRIKKGKPILSLPEEVKPIIEFNKNQLIKLKLKDVVSLNNEDFYNLAVGEKIISRLKVKYYKHYGFDIGSFISCEILGNDTNGLLIIEPKNPWYKIGETYQFVVSSIEKNLDLDGNSIKTAIIYDIKGNKCGVVLDDTYKEKLTNNSAISCKVVGFRKGRPQLEIDPN